MVFRDNIAEQRVVAAIPIGQDLTFHDLHHAALLIFQLLAEDHDGVCLRHIAEKRFIGHIHGSFAQGHHAAVGRLAGVGVDSGQHRHAHAGGLLRGIGLGTAHLAHHQDVRVEAQADIHQRDLIDPLTLIFAVAGQGVDHRVDHLTVFLPHQLQFAGAVFDGKDTLTVGDRGQQPACRRGLAGGGGASHTDGDPIAQKYGKPVQHFRCGCAAAEQILTAEIVAVDNSDGGGNAHILIHHGGLHSRNTGVAGQVSRDQRTGVVQYHAGSVEHTTDDGERMFRRIEMLFQFLISAIRILHFDIPPRVDVDFLNAVSIDVAGQKAILRHLRIDGVRQFRLRHACYGDTLILQVLGDIALKLLFCIFATLRD